MDARRTSQFNIRSAFVRRRAHELAAQTGMTATQIVEEALRAYAPPVADASLGALVRRGRLLVGSSHGGVPVSQAQADAELDAIRGGARD